MLYRYHYIKRHKMHLLNKHLLFFIRKIRSVRSNARFTPAQYFHSSFLNAKGIVAPHGRANHSLHEKFKAFFSSFKALNANSRVSFYNLILNASRFHLYFDDDTIDVRPLQKANIRSIMGNSSFDELMDALWNSLKTNSWDIDKHYEEIYKAIPVSKICCFCGINQMANPKSYRADYDHLGYKGSYPISCIDLRNLAPSCSECNQRYKHDTDVFYTDHTFTQRRRFNNPFLGHVNISIDLAGSIFPNTDILNDAGHWSINIVPDDELTRTWDTVYGIKYRYISDVLNVDYNTWLGEFIDELKGRQIKTNFELRQHFIKHFKRYGKNRLQKRYLIKSSLFRYFYKSNNIALYRQILTQI